jgi:SpoVK/Ycf46/Vps4 family AAA+-type ATPase
MIPKIDNDQVKNDWLFVLQQAKNGDKKAEKIYRTFEYFRRLLNEYFREIETCIPSYRFVFWNRINELQDEKANLLKKYKIRRKRAKYYLNNLKREKKKIIL